MKQVKFSIWNATDSAEVIKREMDAFAISTETAPLDLKGCVWCEILCIHGETLVSSASFWEALEMGTQARTHIWT